MIELTKESKELLYHIIDTLIEKYTFYLDDKTINAIQYILDDNDISVMRYPESIDITSKHNSLCLYAETYEDYDDLSEKLSDKIVTKLLHNINKYIATNSLYRWLNAQNYWFVDTNHIELCVLEDEDEYYVEIKDIDSIKREFEHVKYWYHKVLESKERFLINKRNRLIYYDCSSKDLVEIANQYLESMPLIIGITKKYCIDIGLMDNFVMVYIINNTKSNSFIPANDKQLINYFLNKFYSASIYNTFKQVLLNLSRRDTIGLKVYQNYILNAPVNIDRTKIINVIDFVVDILEYITDRCKYRYINDDVFLDELLNNYIKYITQAYVDDQDPNIALNNAIVENSI